MTYYFSVVNGYLECTNSRKTIISDYVNFHTAHFTLDSSWVGYSKTATFINQKSGVSTNVVLGVESTDCIIPWESLEATVEGGYFIVGLSGYKDTSVIRTRMTTPILIEKSDVNDGDNPIPPTPDEYEQIMDLISSMGGTYTLPTASSTTLGGIKIGTHLNIDGSGVANVNHVSTTIDGVMSSTDKIKLDGIDDNANDYSLPTASNSILGGIKIGTNLSIDGNGIVSSTDTTYSVATQTENGLMSSTDKTKVDGLSNYNLPMASNSVLGGVKVGNNLSIDGNGVLSSTSTTYGIATETTDGLMPSEDKVKLNDIVGDVVDTPSTYVIRDNDADIQTNGIDFDLTPTVDTIHIGHIQWNPTFLCLSYGVKEDSAIEIGQEHVFPIRNGLNVTLENGKVVYWTEALGASGRVKVGLFIANGTISAERVLGVSTHNLTPNEDGHSTWLGSVRGINTSGSLYGETWVDGDVLYASSTIAGGMTKVQPSCPNIAIRLGIVIKAHATNGQIALKPQTYPLAKQVCVEDVDNYYTTTTVEGILDEVGEKLTNLFDDLPPVPFLTAKTGTNIPTLATFNGNIKQYTFAVNNEVFGTSEVTHLYKQGTDLRPHIHWATNGTNTTDRYVKWELEYCFANMDGTFTTPTVITSEALIQANSNSLKHLLTDLPHISGTGVLIGAYLCWRVRRISSVGTAPTNNPFGLALGIHVEQSALK